MDDMLSPTADRDACRRLINDIERILELMSDEDRGVLVPDENGVDIVDVDDKATLFVYYTLSSEEKSQEEDSLKSTVLHMCEMCLSLDGEHLKGGYMIKIIRALNDEVRRVEECIVSSE